MDEFQELQYTTNFKIIKKIATGGMGSIYLAEQLGAHGFRKTVAIKTIRASLLSNQESLDLFIGEAKLVADLVHENIVQVYQFEKSRGMYYLVMEYAYGENLERFMQRHHFLRKPVAVDVGVFIIHQLCRGLDYAHKKRDRSGRRLRIVHRDISPSNVIITYNGVVKLTDFGIAKAKITKVPDEREVVMGKYPYMSPEQARFEVTDARSDIFSLGLVTYELLGGKMVFDVNDGDALLEAMERPITPVRFLNNRIPEQLNDIIMRALQLDPNKRFQSAKEMAHQLEECMYQQGYRTNNEKLAQYMELLFPEARSTTH